MIYLTSDLHFFHTNIIQYQYEQRPFDSIEEMNTHISEYWKATVQKNDELYILGDIAMGHKTKAIELLRTLPGKIHLIRGNHDNYNKTQEAELFESAAYYKILKYQGQRIVLFHFPIEEWDRCYYGDIHLHGHTHGNMKSLRHNRFDIGWDVHQRFIPIDEVLTWRVDDHVPHHGVTKRRSEDMPT